MRKLLLLLYSSVLPLASINADYIKSEGFTMNGYTLNYISNIYEPVGHYASFNVEGEVEIVKGKDNSALRLRYELYSPYKFNGDTAYSYGYACKSFSYPNTSNIKYSFRINDIDDNARYGIKVKFGLYDTSSKNYLNYIESYLYDKSSNNIDIDEIDYQITYEPCLYLSNEKIVESFNFNNFSHIVELDNYQTLDISALSFEYSYIRDITYEEAYIEFTDSNNLFPYIESENNKKKIPIYLLDNNGTISFIYKDLYVDESTFDMSIKEREGFKKTNRFYLPKNKLNELQGYMFTLGGVNIGVSNICFVYGFQIGVERLLLGPCNKSNYCIVGGIKR